MNEFFVFLVIVIAFSSSVFAQQTADEYAKGEVFAGYSGATLFTGDKFEPVENGFEFSGVYNVHRYFGIKADFSGTYRKVDGNYQTSSSPLVTLGSYQANHSLYNAAVGVQFKDNRRTSKLKPFGHVLIGYGKHTDKFPSGCPSGAVCPPFNADFSGTSLIIGGGLDIKINRRIDIRAIQFDLDPIFYKFDGQTFAWKNNRFSTGIVFKF